MKACLVYGTKRNLWCRLVCTSLSHTQTVSCQCVHTQQRGEQPSSWRGVQHSALHDPCAGAGAGAGSALLLALRTSSKPTSPEQESLSQDGPLRWPSRWPRGSDQKMHGARKHARSYWTAYLHLPSLSTTTTHCAC